MCFHCFLSPLWSAHDSDTILWCRAGSVALCKLFSCCSQLVQKFAHSVWLQSCISVFMYFFVFFVCVVAVMLSQKKEGKERPKLGTRRERRGPDRMKERLLQRKETSFTKERNALHGKERVTAQMVLWVWTKTMTMGLANVWNRSAQPWHQ